MVYTLLYYRRTREQITVVISNNCRFVSCTIIPKEIQHNIPSVYYTYLIRIL